MPRMAKKKSRPAEPRESAREPERPAASAFPPRTWAALAALAAVSACVALFLWMELVLLRSGGTSFCAGMGERFDCSQVWNGGFASLVHRLTGLPIAGWGIVWSAVAFVLPLAGLLRVSQDRPTDALVSAVRLTGLAGAVGIVVMLAASFAAGALCIGCLATDALVAAYAVLALRGWRGFRFPEAGRAVGTAAGIAAISWVLLLYPGIRTPRASGQAGREAIAAASAGSPSENAAAPAPVPAGEAPPAGQPAAGPPYANAGTGDPRRDKSLADLVASLDPSMKQTLADSLAIYRASPVRPLAPPRALVGSDLARVRITEFTDILCEHCASLQDTLKTVRENVPPGSFSVDARQFPLDGRCNALLQPDKGDEVRCVAAKLRICAEPTGKEPQLAEALFAKQQGLTSREAMRIASQILPAEQIGACLDAASTKAKLDADVASASQFDSDGTPIVVVNGRKGTSFGPFLYAMVLTRGQAEHPAFAALPPGNPAAHLH